MAWNARSVEAVLETVCSVGRVPGAAVAIVVNDNTVFTAGYGFCDLDRSHLVTAATHYPIASTTKAFNATLLAVLVDEGILGWDRPVHYYLPWFRLGGEEVSKRITIRDLVAMRTGLPRHDWMWTERSITRAELVRRLGDLEVTAGLRERFKYNNLTVTTAGHIAEVVTGKRWEELIKQKILQPLDMTETTFERPRSDTVTRSYHENRRRELVETRRLNTEVNAPAGGVMYSTVRDMARWVAANLNAPELATRLNLRAETIAEIHSPQISTGDDPSAPSKDASYALGWFSDSYRGKSRLSHGGYAHDVSSEVCLFPSDRIGIVSFTNFGPPRLATVINRRIFCLTQDLEPEESVEAAIEKYEKKLARVTEKHAGVGREDDTSPSVALRDYSGVFRNDAYGEVFVQCDGIHLKFTRGGIALSLSHWHRDTWVPAETDEFATDACHPFDHRSLFEFLKGPKNSITGVTIQLEPECAPILFQRVSEGQ